MKQDTPTIVPYKDSKLSKKEQIAGMFNDIAPHYDFMNHFLSLGIDKIWRRKAINMLKNIQPVNLLDVASGTGDFAVTAYRMLQPQKITGIDISEGMLELGQKKIQRLGLQDNITFETGDSEDLQFPDKYFDGITVAFGVRNFENLEKGLEEMLRVLKPGGKAVILEFSQPTVFPIKQLFHFYFRYITPYIGKWIARNQNAYSYLPHSVRVFPQGKKMTAILEKIGYQQVICRPLTFGICTIYCGSH